MELFHLEIRFAPVVALQLLFYCNVCVTDIHSTYYIN